MKEKKVKKIRESVFLFTLMAISFFALIKWSEGFRKESDKIKREHIIRGVGLEIKDYIDLAGKTVETLTKTGSLKQCLKSDKDTDHQLLTGVLENFKVLADASLIYVMDKHGFVKCSTIYNSGKTLIGNNYSFRYYFRAAMKGKKILYPAVGVTTGKRGIYISKPIKIDNEVAGVAVVKIDMTGIDKVLRNAGSLLLLSTPDGIVFSANDENLLLKAIKPLSSAIRKKIELNRQYPDLSPEVLEVKDNLPLMIGKKSYRVLKRNIPIDDWTLTLLTPESAPYPPFSESHKKLFILIGVLLFGIFVLLQLMIIYKSER